MRPEDDLQSVEKRTVHDWGAMSWHMDDTIQPGADVSVATMMVLPGKTSPAHRHDNVNEVIHVIKGTAEQRVGNRWATVAAGSTVFVPKGAIHQTQNIGDAPVSMLISYSGGNRHYEEVEP